MVWRDQSPSWVILMKCTLSSKKRKWGILKLRWDTIFFWQQNLAQSLCTNFFLNSRQPLKVSPRSKILYKFKVSFWLTFTLIRYKIPCCTIHIQLIACPSSNLRSAFGSITVPCAGRTIQSHIRMWSVIELVLYPYLLDILDISRSTAYIRQVST